MNETNNNSHNSINFHKERPSVSDVFSGRSVFITGASGFIGRVLLEKLLRAYPGIKRIYILLRTKRNQSPHERLHKQVLNVPLFDLIRDRPDGKQLLDKIVVVPGDIAEPNLGISEPDLKVMLEDETLAIVFHSAATIKFDEPIRKAVMLNLVATNTVVEICRKLPNLISFCHVSTAYVNAHILSNKPIYESLYPMDQKPEQLIKMAEIMDEPLMQQLKLSLVHPRPNTYTYTKALAEHLVASSGLPVVIVRPAIVAASWLEPIKGWIDNINGPTGLLVAVGKGLMRSMYVQRDCKADLIPVDVVANTMIAASYYVATTNPAPIAKTDHDQTQSLEVPNAQSSIDNEGPTSVLGQPPVIHCSSGEINPITWGQLEDECFPVLEKYPSSQVFRYPGGSFKANKYHDIITRFFVHLLPALIIDTICLIFGRKRQLMNIYGKLHAAIAAIMHFPTTIYMFKARNIKLLQAYLPEKDRQELYMDIERIEWLKYFESYVLGTRRYVLNEDDSTLPEARKSLRRIYYIELLFEAILIVIFAYLLSPFLLRLSPVALIMNLLRNWQ